ncbi:MAG: hypothetical protein WKF91_15535 [Segetibacter sp.]
MHSVIKSPFLFCEARHLIEGAGFIISTTAPFEIGRVLTFKDNDQYLSSMANSTWPVATVPGYRILVQYSGTLQDGRRMMVQDTTQAQIQNLLKNMAGFFQKEKIDLHTGYYKKFLVTSSTPPPKSDF